MHLGPSVRHCTSRCTSGPPLLPVRFPGAWPPEARQVRGVGCARGQRRLQHLHSTNLSLSVTVARSVHPVADHTKSDWALGACCRAPCLREIENIIVGLVQAEEGRPLVPLQAPSRGSSSIVGSTAQSTKAHKLEVYRYFTRTLPICTKRGPAVGDAALCGLADRRADGRTRRHSSEPHQRGAQRKTS